MKRTVGCEADEWYHADMMLNHGKPQSEPYHDEPELIIQLKAGEQAAYERFVRTYSGPMLAVARRFLGNEEDARDVLQEAFVSAFKAIASFQGTSQVGAWFRRIVINTALMRLRAAKRVKETPIEDLLPCFSDTDHREIPEGDWRQTPDQLLHQSDIRHFVRAAIKRLPLQYQWVLVMRDIEELSTRESAELLDVTENTVKLRLHRARQALRSLLAPHLGAYA